MKRFQVYLTQKSFKRNQSFVEVSALAVGGGAI